MKILLNGLLALCVASMLFLSSCNEDPVIPNQEELITTVIWTLTPDGGGDAVEFRFTDIDGDGGNAPDIKNDTLAANTTYNASVRFLNESEAPAEEITTEVAAENEDHQVFYILDSGLNFKVIYDDMDADGNPLGLATEVSTTDAGTGTAQVVLRHQPNKNAAGVSDGSITNAGGETDIEVEFDITVE